MHVVVVFPWFQVYNYLLSNLKASKELEENNLPEWRRIGLSLQGVPRGAYLLYVTLGATQKTEL